MFRLFTLILLIFCAGCTVSVPTAENHATDPVFKESTARQKCRENLLDIRIEENWQMLREELQKQTLEHSLAGRVATLSTVPDAVEYQSVRKALHTAQLFLQELTAPDTATARHLLRSRSAELLDMELAELTTLLFAKEQEINALEEALKKEENAPALQQELARAREELAETRMGIRTMLGLPAGLPFVLQKDTVIPAPLPQDRKLETALACRKELQGSKLSPAELAAAVRAWSSGKFPTPRHRALAAARTLLRTPRELYKRELADRNELEGMRELLTAIGIAAELELAQAEYQEAQKAAETAALLAGDDPRSKAITAKMQAKVATARVHLAATLGSWSGDYPQTGSRPEPPAQLMKLLELLEKWENE